MDASADVRDIAAEHTLRFMYELGLRGLRPGGQQGSEVLSGMKPFVSAKIKGPNPEVQPSREDAFIKKVSLLVTKSGSHTKC